jgi:hypothetical protein
MLFLVDHVPCLNMRAGAMSGPTCTPTPFHVTYRFRALEQRDEKQKEIFIKEALRLSDDAVALAANDEEVKRFHAKLVDEIDPVPIEAS